MKSNYKKTYLIIIILIPVILSSCEKFVQVTPPVNQVISASVFSNDQSAISTVVGIYSQMMTSSMYFMNGAMTLYPGLSADELYNTSPNSNLDPFTNNAIPATSSVIQNDIWRNAYQYIYQANACLEGIAQSTGLSLAVKDQLQGELKFTRAICYFYLTNLFGEVPLELTTDYIVNEKMPRTSQVKIYEQILTDLQDAVTLLNPEYITPDRTRPNKWAAMALLARVYLYQQKWNEADSAATAVINSSQYQLDNDLDSVFLSGSAETIWQLYPVNPYLNTAEGQYFIPSSNATIPSYAITPFLMNAFETGDQRKTYWLDSSNIGGQTYYYPYKYKVSSGSNKTEYYIVLRLAEQYLIRAEARAQENNLSGAIADLNMIRNRAGLPDETANDQLSVLYAIAHENQVEFFCEWGHRWFDLKRSGSIDNVLGAEKSGWKPTDALYPIPFSEIQSNPFLTQNPGY